MSELIIIKGTPPKEKKCRTESKEKVYDFIKNKENLEEETNG